MSRRRALGRGHWLAMVLGVAIMAGLLVPASAVAATALTDSYSEVYRQSELDLTPWDPAGQTFIAGIGGTLDSCKFLLRRVGPITGSLYAQLWAHTGVFGVDGKPTGTVLATSAAVDVSTISESWALVTFTFDNTVPVVEGTPYVTTVEYASGIDGTLYLGLDWGGYMLHPGTGIYFSAGEWQLGAADVPFYVYVTLPDAEAPVIDVNVAEGQSYALPMTITFSANDAVDGPVTPTATLDGNPFTSGTSVTSGGGHTLVVTAEDTSGNTAVSTVHFTVDPLPVVSTPASSGWSLALSLALAGGVLLNAETRRRRV